jgi:hypothetical protein
VMRTPVGRSTPRAPGPARNVSVPRRGQLRRDLETNADVARGSGAPAHVHPALP